MVNLGEDTIMWRKHLTHLNFGKRFTPLSSGLKYCIDALIMLEG